MTCTNPHKVMQKPFQAPLYASDGPLRKNCKLYHGCWGTRSYF